MERLSIHLGMRKLGIDSVSSPALLAKHTSIFRLRHVPLCTHEMCVLDKGLVAK